MDITHLREDYRREALNRETLRPDPMDQFRFWFDQARETELKEPNAMVLATVDESGQPFTRTVLLKKLEDEGLVFFTNYESRKASNIAGNAKVAKLLGRIFCISAAFLFSSAWLTDKTRETLNAKD